MVDSKVEKVENDKKINFTNKIWTQISDLKLNAWVQSESGDFPKYKISEYFEPVTGSDNKLTLKLKTKSSAMVTFLESAIEKLKTDEYKYELVLVNGYIEINKINV